MGELSRWATKAEERPAKAVGSKRALAQGQGSSKRARAAQGAGAKDDDYDGLTAGLDGFFGKKQGRWGMHDNARPTSGILKKVMPLLCYMLRSLTCVLLLCAVIHAVKHVLIAYAGQVVEAAANIPHFSLSALLPVMFITMVQHRNHCVLANHG